MARVIDDDGMARKLIDHWTNNNSPDSNRASNRDNLLMSLRAQAPNWWDAIDPRDEKTYVDAIVWNRRDVTFRRYVCKVAGEGELFYVPEGGEGYKNAEPFIKESTA